MISSTRTGAAVAAGVAAAAVVVLSAALAACGGGGKSGSAATTSAAAASPGTSATSARSHGASGQNDCQMLTAVAYDLGEFDTTGTGFDYVSDRSFLDSYAGRAPGGIAASARRVRDLLDRLAKAEQDAGVAVSQDPSESQLAKIKGEVHFSSDEQAQNAQALNQLVIYAGTSC